MKCKSRVIKTNLDFSKANEVYSKFTQWKLKLLNKVREKHYITILKDSDTHKKMKNLKILKHCNVSVKTPH